MNVLQEALKNQIDIWRAKARKALKSEDSGVVNNTTQAGYNTVSSVYEQCAKDLEDILAGN